MSLLPSFPSSPTNGQIASVGDYTYVYSSATDSWEGQLGGDSGSGSFAQVFTSSGTFTVPTGVSAVKVTVIGGGGGGAGGNQVACGGGGGGGVAVRWVTGLTPGATVAVTVGAAGTAGTGNGGTGGTSSFGSYASATGGAGGVSVSGGSYVTGQAAGGIGSNGDLNITGGGGGIGTVGGGGEFVASTSYAGAGGGSSGESGSSGYLALAASATTGTRPFGGGAGYLGGRGGDGGIQTITGSSFTVGQAGTGWGNGGSGLAYGTYNAQSGGAGSPGIVLVEWSASVLVVSQTTGGGLGYSQAWTDVSGSRTFGVTYTNTTGKPIQILVVASTSGVGGGINLNINGVALPGFFAYSGSVTVTSPPLIVPVGATYLAAAYGNSSYAAWYELR